MKPLKVIQITKDLDPEIIKKHLDPSLDFSYRPVEKEEDIISQAAEAQILISIYEPINRQVLDRLGDLRLIALGSIGFDVVDLGYARQKGIDVSNNPSYCLDEVADHTVGLILDRVRRISSFSQAAKLEYKWDYNLFGNKLWRMRGKVAGLIGFGQIARRVARRLKGFGVEILAYDPMLEESVFLSEGVERVGLDQIQQRAHIISLHLPLNNQTHHIIDKAFVEGLVKPVIFINSSRGGLVDEGVYGFGLREEKFLGLGLDVLESEDPDLRRLDFIGDERLTLTPHSAFYSIESDFDASYHVARYVNLYARGEYGELPIVNE